MIDQTDHVRCTKRRRLRSDSIVTDPAIKRIVPFRTHSPIVASSCNVNLSLNGADGGLSDSSSHVQLFTQSPHIPNNLSTTTTPSNGVFYAPDIVSVHCIPSVQKEKISIPSNAS